MNDTARKILLAAALMGAVAVALGAFGAHGLKDLTDSAPDGAKRLEWWATGARYNMWHAILLAVIASLAQKRALPGLMRSAAIIIAGTAVFSGTLYIMTLTGIRWLGAITPIGGLLLIVGWLSLFMVAYKARAND